MHYAIDIDGTITTYPAAFRELIGAMRTYGNRVTVLTGGVSLRAITPEDYIHAKAARINQLIPLIGSDLTEWVEAHPCLGMSHDEVMRMKAEWIKANAVDCFMDDDLGYCEMARKASPKTLVLRVMP